MSAVWHKDQRNKSLLLMACVTILVYLNYLLSKNQFLTQKNTGSIFSPLECIRNASESHGHNSVRFHIEWPYVSVPFHYKTRCSEGVDMFALGKSINFMWTIKSPIMKFYTHTECGKRNATVFLFLFLVCENA